jgi:hypothetical protein
MKSFRRRLFKAIAAASLLLGLGTLVLLIRSLFVFDNVGFKFHNIIYVIDTRTGSIDFHWVEALQISLTRRSQNGAISYSEAATNNFPPRLSYDREASPRFERRRALWFFFSHDDGQKLAMPSWKPTDGLVVVSGRVFRLWILSIPGWIILTCAGALFCWSSRRYQKGRLPGFCNFCGYDLRATPDRCPECGAVPSKP